MLAPSVPRRAALPLLATLLPLNGIAVSTLYWSQAMAGLARSELGDSLWVGLMPSAALAGYAIGVSLLAAVARDLTTASGIGLHALLLAVGLSAAAVAPAAPGVTASCLLIGIGCAVTQRALACATSAVAPGQRGPVIGCVIASGLVGIVLARALVPIASAALGWRTLFILDSAIVSAAGLAAALAAQHVDRRGWETDAAPLPSALALWRQDPVIRRAALHQACVFAAFNAGWGLFPRALATAGVAGALPMGSVAALGAVAALVAGWSCRRKAAASVARLGLAAVGIACLGALGATGAGPTTLVVMILLDMGTQTALVANQAQAQARATSAAMRGRIAAIVTTVGFAAGAAGAALGNILL